MFYTPKKQSPWKSKVLIMLQFIVSKQIKSSKFQTNSAECLKCSQRSYQISVIWPQKKEKDWHMIDWSYCWVLSVILIISYTKETPGNFIFFLGFQFWLSGACVWVWYVWDLLDGLVKAIWAVRHHQSGSAGNHPVIVIKEVLLQRKRRPRELDTLACTHTQKIKV